MGSERVARAREIIHETAQVMPPDYSVIEIEKPIGMSGFTIPVESGVDDLVFYFNPWQIVATCTTMEDGVFEDYVESIVDWWLGSTLPRAMGLNLELAFERFAKEAPYAASSILSHPAVLAGTPLLKWLAPTDPVKA